MDKSKSIGCGTGCQVGAVLQYAAKLEAALESFAAVDRARQAESAELEAKVERLEKALQEILDSGQGDLYSMKVAKTALEGKQE